jgi:aspartyl-tRNA(Asn)/glutamyl-tRNA(Gln) amidotransferase subunit A
MKPIDKLTGSDIGRDIETGALCPVEVTEYYLDRAQDHPFNDRIFTMHTADRARAEAMAARDRAKSGTRLGLLDGVPVSWKDLFDTAGDETISGTHLLKGRVPTEDAEVVKNATRGGSVCLGKTHMTELAFSGLGLNPVTQTPPNVNDYEAAPGGSSSGAATSVAFDLAPLSVGSDTGGSVRIPSAWNDLVGLKTTAGRVSCQGVVPLIKSFDTVGPLVRSVEDAAQMLALMEGTAVPDLAVPEATTLRFAVLNTVAFDDIREEPRDAFQSAVERFERAGIKVDRIDVSEVNDALGLSGTLFAPEAYGEWKHRIEEAPDLMFVEILKRFRAGADVSAADYVAGWNQLHALRKSYLAQTNQYDAVLVPTSPILPPNAARLLEDDDYFVTENLLALRNTRIGNLMGLCGVTLPTGIPSCGIQLMGKPMDEYRLLAVSMAAERALS